MPKLKPDIQRARREHILDAAEQCFARAGFHRTTMHDICKEAGVSPGAFYVYFDSKEALIAGIAERDRADFAERLAALAAAPDFLQALKELGEHYFVHEPAYRRQMCIEIGLESTRNPRVGEIFREVDAFVASSFEKLFQRMKDEGRIAPDLDIPMLTQVFLRDRRRPVLAPRRRSCLRRQHAGARRAEGDRGAAQTRAGSTGSSTTTSSPSHSEDRS